MKKGFQSRRYLYSIDPTRIFHLETDCLILGSGIAGLSAALSAARNEHVIVLTKKFIQATNTKRAQGGIACCLAEEDSIETHVQDTLRVGHNFCKEKVVRFILERAPEMIDQLIDWGVQFDHAVVGGGGKEVTSPSKRKGLALTKEAGHSFSRILHARGDSTGKEIQEKLVFQVLSNPNIHLYENTYAIDLITKDQTCLGMLVYRENIGFILIWAKKIILSSGGAGYLYRETTNNAVTTSDGIAMAYRAGCKLADLEFFQFHPTALYVAGAPRILISEAVRGEGAYLVDKSGYRFMKDYHPDMELAPRDVVSRSILQHQNKTQENCVYLTLKHLDANYIQKRFPLIHKTCQSFSLDFTQDPIPVRPSAHYMIGGVAVDEEGHTSLKNLFACGEVTCNGFHGANRLASNSLLEGLVMGYYVGALPSGRSSLSRQEVFPRQETLHNEEVDYVDMANSIRSLMWHNVGIMRNQALLQKALTTLDQWANYILPIEFQDSRGWELQNMLITARLMAFSALKREESRGVHFRDDFPKRNPSQDYCHTELWRASEEETQLQYTPW